MRTNLGLLLLCIGLASCKKEPEYLSLKFENVDKSRAYRNTFLPKELRSRILEGLSADSAHVKAKPEHGEAKPEHSEGPKLSEIGADGFARMRVNVYLIEKTQGVLKHSNYKFDYGPGGGELDLADYVDKNKKGTFYLAFQIDPQEQGEVSAWYLSNTRKRNIDGDMVGNGCNTFFDITKYFSSEMSKKGFTVNSTDQRYVSALSGQYFLRAKKEGRVAIATIDILDSRYKNLLCR